MVNVDLKSIKVPFADEEQSETYLDAFKQSYIIELNGRFYWVVDISYNKKTDNLIVHLERDHRFIPRY